VAIVTVPVRSAPVLAVRLRTTVPLPDPDAPEVTLIHDVLLAAVHEHPSPVITLTVPCAASGPMLASVGEIEYVHGAVPAA
jgi:hypothetical protein